ncbi:MAG: hypothetical protein M1334_01280 [Patescibacteria group bacterium]|nr:hypothetical protein [Patescibacteria group bacterium]
MKKLDKIISFMSAINVVVFIAFILAGVICGLLRTAIPHFLVAGWVVYIAVVAFIIVVKPSVFLIKPVNKTKKKIRKIYRFTKFIIKDYLDFDDF